MIKLTRIFFKQTFQNYLFKEKKIYLGLKMILIQNTLFESLLCIKTMQKKIKIARFNPIPKFSINEKPYLFRIMTFLKNGIVFSSQRTNREGLFRNNFRNATFQAKQISLEWDKFYYFRIWSSCSFIKNLEKLLRKYIMY